jgi:hypothetical protein
MSKLEELRAAAYAADAAADAAYDAYAAANTAENAWNVADTAATFCLLFADTDATYADWKAAEGAYLAARDAYEEELERCQNLKN